MKSFILFLILANFPFAYSQDISNDTTIIRWIIVDRGSENEFLFSNSNLSDSNVNLIQLIENAIADTLKIFFLETSDIESKTKLYPSIKSYINDDSLLNYRLDPFMFNDHYNSLNSFYIIIDEQKNLTLEDNDPVLMWCYGYSGFECYAYPTKSYYKFPKKDIQKIKIREELKRDAITNELKYQPVGITFSPCYKSLSNFEIWIDITKLKYAYPLNDTFWFEYFMSMSYSGKQYMQKE